MNSRTFGVAALPVVGWKNAKTFGAVGNGTADDTAAIQAAIDAVPAAGGCAYLPSGNYLITAPLRLRSAVRITGDAFGRAKITGSNTDVFDMDPGALLDRIEIDHLTIDVTGGHAFAEARVQRASLHHLDVHVRSSNKSVWSATAVVNYIEVWFTECQLRVYGATRSVPAFHLASPGIDLITANVWQKVVCWNENTDATQYFFKVVCSHASGANRDNTWRDVIFEQCAGGGIALETATGTLLEGVHCWDVHDDAMLNDFVSVTRNASASAPSAGTTIVGCSRSGGGPASGVQDIKLGADCLQTTIVGFTARGTSVVPRIDLGGSRGVVLVNAQTGTLLSGTAAAGYVAGADGALTVHSGQDANMIQVINDTVGGNLNAPCYRGESAAAAALMTTSRVTGDTVARYARRVDGQEQWGGGAGPRDLTLYRSAAGVLCTDHSLDVVTSALGIFTPRDQGMVAWSLDPAEVRTGFLTVNGTVYLVGVKVARAADITKLFWSVSTAGATPTAGQNEVGLYNAAGVKLVSANVDAAVSSVGGKSTTVASTPVTPGLYWLGMVFNASTAPTIGIAGSVSASITSLGLSAAGYRFATNGTGATALPASITPGSNTALAHGVFAAIG